MTDNLDTLSDAALSETFAVEVAGFRDDPHMPQLFWLDAEGNAVGKHDDDGVSVDFFATSADAVLPWLPNSCDAWRNGIGWFFCLYTEQGNIRGDAPTFARAAAIAFIRAKRAEKGGSK